MVELQAHLEELESLGARVVAIARDDAQALKELAEDSGLGYPVLHDAEGETVIRYGILNEGFTRGVLPHPTVLVIDEEGTVRYKRVDIDYRERPPVGELVAAVEALGGNM